MNTLNGIDVSKNQPSVNWDQVKQGGYTWVILRAGYQGYTQGGLKTDPYFKPHIEGATRAGLAVGVYWICQAVTTQEAVRAADYCCDLLAPYSVPLGVWWDNEPTEAYPNGRADTLDKALRTQIGLAFLQQVQKRGYLAGVYTNLDYSTYKLEYNKLEQYPLWLAQWNVSKPSRDCSIWQVDAGDVPGVSTKCDRNVMMDADMIAIVRDHATEPSNDLSNKDMPYVATVTASALNVRSGAGTNHPVRVVLPRNTQVTILREVNGWGCIEIKPDYYGWLSLQYVKK